MTVKELYDKLNATVPASLCADWDNDGLACLPDASRKAKKVLVALDITDHVVQKAIDGGFDAIVAHQPLLFRGIKALTAETGVSRKLLQLARADIAAISLHTRLDAVSGGVNDTLALLLGLQSVTSFGTAEEGELGRIGTLPRPVSAHFFADFVREKLGTSAVLFAGDADKEVRTVALVGGEGGDFLPAAVAAGADLFLSGRIGYHRMLDAAEEGIAVIEAGHYATEAPVCARLVEILHDIDPDLEIEVVSSQKIEIIC